MSVHTSTPPQSVECGQCGDQFLSPPPAGSFCSPKCHTEHRREKLADDFFETLEHDHRFCSTCGRQTKEIEKPPGTQLRGKSITDAAIGWEHVTEHGEFGVKSSVVQDDDDDEPDVPDLDFEDGHDPVYVFELGDETHNVGTYRDFRNPLEPSIRADEPVPTGTICRCGQTDHKHESGNSPQTAPVHHCPLPDTRCRYPPRRGEDRHPSRSGAAVRHCPRGRVDPGGVRLGGGPLMTVQPIEGLPVEIRFAGRRLGGVVDEVRWTPTWGEPRSEIVVDADGTTITTGRANVRPISH